MIWHDAQIGAIISCLAFPIYMPGFVVLLGGCILIAVRLFAFCQQEPDMGVVNCEFWTIFGFWKEENQIQNLRIYCVSLHSIFNNLGSPWKQNQRTFVE